MKVLLDITDYKETGLDLIKAIERGVNDTQRVIIRELPNVLKMTQAQFDDLMKMQNTVSYMSAVTMPDQQKGAILGNTKMAYIFYTPLNAMDVDVDGEKDLLA